ncbi:MAG: hypothetical protein ACI9U2_001490 [Bradymonadia bacterium]|jgi:hypothetical protein
MPRRYQLVGPNCDLLHRPAARLKVVDFDLVGVIDDDVAARLALA